ncbi:hypothetical protein FQA39_LY02665 [Lamprigera yunnana]|nr:hypothetical protein FQA39_LY02665 [Lamprigera yunnana]
MKAYIFIFVAFTFQTFGAAEKDKAEDAETDKKLDSGIFGNRPVGGGGGSGGGYFPESGGGFGCYCPCAAHKPGNRPGGNGR